MNSTTPITPPANLAPPQTGQRGSFSEAPGSAPWAWTFDRNMEYWHPAGKSRDEAISAGKRHGRKIFWIARTRPMTEDEKEEMDGSWVIDPTTEEKILPNVKSEPRPYMARSLRKQDS